MEQTTLLVQFALDDGRRFVEALHSQPEFDLNAAFWHYHSDLDRWTLIIATPIVDKAGAGAAYERIIATIDAMEPPFQWLQFTDVYAKSPNDPLVVAARENNKPIAIASPGRFVRGTYWNEFYIDEAYLYYVA